MAKKTSQLRSIPNVLKKKYTVSFPKFFPEGNFDLVYVS